MSTLEEISGQCVAVCEVPISVPKEIILSNVKRNLRIGKILDSDQVDGIESGNNLTRLVLLLTSDEDVRHLCREIKHDDIQLEDKSFTVKYQRAIACELPERWENPEALIQDDTECQPLGGMQQPGQQAHTGTPGNQKPVESEQYQMPPKFWPGPYGLASGFYHNIPQYPPGGAGERQEDGSQKRGQGQMPHDHMQGQPSSQGRVHGQGHENTPDQGLHGFQGHHMPNFPYEQFQPQYPIYGMPPNFKPDQQMAVGQDMPFPPGIMPFPPGMMQMPMQMFKDPKTGQWHPVPVPGFPNMPQLAEGGRGTPGKRKPHQPSGPPPPYNSEEFKNPGQGQCSEVKSPHEIPESGQPMKSRAELDQDEKMQKLKAKINKEQQDQVFTETQDDQPQCETGFEEQEEDEGQKEPDTEDRPTKIIVTNLPSTVHEEYLEMFFENKKKYGGGSVVNIEYDEENASVVVEFEELDAVDIVLQKQPIKMMGVEVEVEVYVPVPEEPVSLCTIEVTGPSSVVCEEQLETLQMYFEHKKSFGDEVEEISFDGDVAYVTFYSEEVAGRVAEKNNHVINKKPIQVQLHNPEKAKKQKMQGQAGYSKRGRDDMREKPEEEEEEPMLTVKVKGIKQLPSRDTIEFYFDNKRRSGGYDFEEIKTDDEDDDIVYVKYKSKEVARAVAERSHKLEGINLSVSLYTPPKPPPSYPDKILIKGLKTTTTEDGLFNFIEAKSGYIPVPGSMTFHAEQEGVVMVTLENEPDFEKLENMCAKSKLDGAKLKISPVPLSNCIIVSNLAADVTKDTVAFYFENKRRSNGGPVTKVVMNEDDTCFVFFEDYQVVDRVLDKEHTLSKQQLDVKRYQECLARPEGELGERKLNIPEPFKVKNVNPQKVKFLKNSKANHNALETQMLSCHTRILWSENVDDVTLECILKKEDKDCFRLVKTWEKEAEKNFEDFLNTIAVYQLGVLQDLWQKVMDNLKTITFSNPEAVAVFVDKVEGFVTVVGNKPLADKLKKDLNDIIQKVMDEAEKERQKVNEVLTNLKPIQTKMLLADKFPSRMSELFPEMKVKINQTKNEIIFEGSMGNVRDAKLKMFEMKDKFSMKSIENLPTLSAGLFKLKQTKEYVVKKLKNSSMAGVWEIQEQMLTICSSSEDTLDQCVSIIHGSVIETSIGLTKASASLINSDQWQSKVGEWHSVYVGKSHIAVDNSMSKVQICSTDDIANELLDSVKKFLRYNTVLEEKISCTKNINKLIEKHHKHDISALCRELQNYHVNITTEGYGGFKVNGTEDGITKAKDMMQKLFDKVKQKDHTIVKPGLVKHMISPRGKDNLNTVESTMPCVIGMKGDLDEEESSENLYDTIPADRRNRNIKVKASCKAYDCRNIYTAVADMTEMSVQVLVNAADEKLSLTGGLGKAMAVKGGKEIEKACAEYIKKEGKLGEGEAFICTAGKLKADYIIHVIGPVWRGGGYKEEEMLEEAVFKCMQQASIKNATSMAIPAISSGAYGYPVKHATLTIVKAVKNFFREVQESTLTDIYLCDVKRNTVDQFTKALHTEFYGVKIESDSEEDDYEEGAYASRSAQSGPPSPPSSRPPRRTAGSDNQANIGNISVKITKGELAKEKVDVVVNTTAKNLDLKNGAVSLSLLKAGGQGLQAELKTSYPNGINFGEVAVSGGHNLKCTQVYHTTLTNYDGNNATGSIEALHKLMNSCLLLAQKQKHSVIAFPAIGTGNLGFPKDVVAKEMFKAVSKFSNANSGSSLKEVRFIVYQKDFSTIKAFEAEQTRWSTGEWKSARQNRKVDPAYERIRRNKADSGEDEHLYETCAGSAAKPYENFTVTVKQGDITKEDAECIVNSSNDELDLSRGAVSQALLKKGGASLAQEIKSKKDKMKKKHLVWTSAPGIPCKQIVHVVAQETNKGWKTIIERCLHDAERKKFKSIAFPALGTGFQYEPKEMADVMTWVIAEFDKTKPNYLQEIRIVVFQRDMMKDFQRVLAGPKRNSGFLNSLKRGVKGLFGSNDNDDYAQYTRVKKRKETENHDSVTFVILSMNNNVIEQAIERLESCLEKEIHKKDFSETIISRLDQNQVAEIEAIAKQHNVDITTDLTSGKIQISGIAQNLMNASDKIHGIMRDALALEKQKETAEIMSCLVQWYFIEITEESGQNLEAYEKTMNFRIESAFKSQAPTFTFNSEDDRKYIIDFKKMQEYAEDDDDDVVNVIRRDLFKESMSDTPISWGDFKGNLKVVNLQATDPEYMNIEQKFQATAGNPRKVQQIQRIQNKTLWNQYHTKKKQLEDQNPPNTQNEHFLWHGTAEDAVDSINAHGFNRSYCGKNAVALGNGVYFATQAAYSCQDTYSRPDRNGIKRMYYCRVLTGEYIRGKSGMRVPPPKPSGGSNAIYDSVVDNVNAPGMYIIFNDTQAYPEYLVTFAP